MKLMVVGDVHFSTYSSILRGRGEKYSKRLENLIQSLNWVERISDEKETDAVIYLGDFFDKSELTAEELSALKEVMWNYQYHIFLCGNHEMGRHDHTMSSAHLFNLLPDFTVIETSTINEMDGKTVAFIPYELEVNRTPLPTADIIFSHNDLQISYGAYKSTEGYTVDEIKSKCRLFVNGHLHNHYNDLPNHYVNLGNLTGQNFSEDATKYKHYVMIIDTNDPEHFELIENPYAYEFYKIDYTEDAIPFIDDPSRAVVTVKCYASQLDNVKRTYADCAESRILIAHTVEEAEGGNETYEELTTVDHLQQFRDYVTTEIGNDELTLDELNRVLVL